jgi:hypothetical protein
VARGVTALAVEERVVPKGWRTRPGLEARPTLDRSASSSGRVAAEGGARREDADAVPRFRRGGPTPARDRIERIGWDCNSPNIDPAY